MAGAAFKGLEWATKTFGLEPTWTIEPDLEAAKQVVKSVGVMEDTSTIGTINISFLSQGAFNKIYDISMHKNEQTLILRLTLPVDPRYKTLSEVATMEWIRYNTNIPVPTVVSHDASSANPVGFEWILMTKLPGKPLANAWRSLSYPAKEGLAKRFAEYSSSLFRNQLSGIGNIYAASASLPKVDRIVSMHFFWGDHIHQDVSRGPFSSTKNWMDARLALNEHGCRSTLAKYSNRSDIDSDDEDALDDAERTLKIVNRLKPLVGQIFPVGRLGDEPSMLFHDDLSQNNILVDDDGALTGVLDWECVSALPRWKACHYPSFLEGRPRENKPELARYKREASGEPADLYWEHLMEYELTTLRRIFLDEMARLELGWVEIFNSSPLQRDLDLAVQSCDSEILASYINEWIDETVGRRSNIRSLQDRVDES